MHRPTLRQLRKNFTLQHDQCDCGIACLQNIARFYECETSLEYLRDQSGTGISGATMLGLCQAAEKAGFIAEGVVAENFENIAEVELPCILHLTIDGRLMHYVIYYPPGAVTENIKDHFVIGDPGKGIVIYTKAELEKAWVSKACLLLNPTPQLEMRIRNEKQKWLWLWRVIKENVGLLYAAALLGLVIALLNMSTAVFSQQLVDKILPAGNREKVFIGIALFLFLLLVKSGLTYLRQSLLLKQGIQFNQRLVTSFFGLLLHQEKPFFDNRKTGDLTTRLNDTLRIQQTITYMAGDMVLQLLLVIVTVTFSFFYYWKIGLLCLVLVPLIFGLVYLFRHQVIERQRSVMATHAANESNYIDTIRAIAAIKNLNRQNAFLHRAAHFFSRFQEAVTKLGKVKMKFGFIIDQVAAFFLTAIILWSAVLVLQQHIRVGEMLAILQMSMLLFQHASGVALATIQLQEAKIAFERMYEFTSLTPEKHNSVELPENVFDTLYIQHVSFRFPGRPLLLEEVSLSVKKGETIAIAGESGQGKSTIFQLLQRFYPKDSGEVLLNGLPFDRYSLTHWRTIIGVMPQEVSLVSGTILENIIFNSPVDSDTAERVMAFCRQMGFDRYFSSLPQAYQTVLGEGGIALSGGQKQLLGLARCLYHQPRLLLLDEPTAAMDTETENFVLQLLDRIQAGLAIIIISHKDKLTSIAHRVYHLQKGKLLCQSTNGIPEVS